MVAITASKLTELDLRQRQQERHQREKREASHPDDKGDDRYQNDGSKQTSSEQWTGF